MQTQLSMTLFKLKFVALVLVQRTLCIIVVGYTSSRRAIYEVVSNQIPGTPYQVCPITDDVLVGYHGVKISGPTLTFTYPPQQTEGENTYQHHQEQSQQQ